jgi:Cu+-exporting ATPase
MQTDLVCEMKVNDSTMFKSIYKGVTYYFCSATCKMLFDRDPEKYIKAGQ